MKTSPYWWLAGALLLLLWLMTIMVYPLLPDRIPGHFGPDGRVTRWEDKATFWLLPGLASLLMAIFSLRGLAYRNHALLNMPDKEKFLKLPAQAKEQVLLRLDAHLARLVLVVMAMFGWIQWNTFLVATMAAAGLAGFWVFLVLLIVQVLWMLVDISREITQQSQRTL